MSYSIRFGWYYNVSNQTIPVGNKILFPFQKIHSSNPDFKKIDIRYIVNGFLVEENSVSFSILSKFKEFEDKDERMDILKQISEETINEEKEIKDLIKKVEKEKIQKKKSKTKKIKNFNKKDDNKIEEKNKEVINESKEENILINNEINVNENDVKDENINKDEEINLENK